MSGKKLNYWITSSASDLFDSIDTNKDQNLSRLEIRRSLEANDIPTSERLLDSIFNACDINKDGQISKQEFLKFTEVQNRKLREIFNKIDYDSCGYLTVDEIERVVLGIDPNYSSFNLKRMIKTLDSDGDGKVNFCEFMKFYHMIPVKNIRMTFDFFDKGCIDIGDSITVRNEQDDEQSGKKK